MMRSTNAKSRVRAALTALALFFTGVVAGAAGTSRASHGLVVDTSAGAIPELAVDVQAGVRVRFRTAGTSAGGDPVLHLFSPSNVEVAVNDSGAGGVEALIDFTPPSTGTYTLVLRSRDNATGGETTVQRDGSVIGAVIPFGGGRLTMTGLRAGEEIGTVRKPNGAGPNHGLYVLKPDGLGIEARRFANWYAGQANYAMPAAATSRNVFVGTPGWGFVTPWAAIRVVRNDVVAGDSDDDGLGNGLEATLRTCSSRSTSDPAGSWCGSVVDARDSDGDGIRDRWEVVGRSGGLALPAWGADPRHKDLFVEVDVMQRKASDTPMKMSAWEAKEFARIYGDQVGNPTPEEKSRHAQSLQNPDGREGISVHLDIGTNPPAGSADATIYGDWGGYTFVPMVSEGVGADYLTAWQTYMSTRRRGTFRYALPWCCNSGASVKLNQIAWVWGLGEPRIAAQESAHAMGIDHGGEVAGPNCKPNYPSVVSYAAQDRWDVGFSDGRFPELNNEALTEWAVAAGNPRMLAYARNALGYHVDEANAHIDWDRDGEFAPAGTTVRAYANFDPETAGGCEGTRAGSSQIAGALSDTTPAVAKLGSRTYVFYREDGVLKYVYTTDGRTFSSERSSGMAVGANGGFDVERVRDTWAGRDQFLVVAVDGSGAIHYRRMWLNWYGSEEWSVPTYPWWSSGVAGQPSLARIGAASANLALLAFKTSGGYVQTVRWNGEAFEAPEYARTPDYSAIRLGEGASPGIGYVFTPFSGERAIYGAFVTQDGLLRLWMRSNTDGRWRDASSVMDTLPRGAIGRPTLAWVPKRSTSDYPGRLYLGYTPGDMVLRWQKSYAKVTTSGGVVSKQQRVGLDTFFDNAWHSGYGISFDWEPGDSNLRAAMSFADSDGPPKDKMVLYKPKADGISGTLRPYDDWAQLRLGLCRWVVNPGGTVSDPIRCP